MSPKLLSAFSVFVLFIGPAFGAVEVHGHRGARAVRPENTLSAFRYALDLGVDYLELDMGITKDRKIVVNHDTQINLVICQKTGEPRDPKKEHGPFIKDLTLNEIKAYDCGSLKNPRFNDQVLSPGERIPTLDEVFDLAKKSDATSGRETRFNIEIKVEDGSPSETIGFEEFTDLVVKKVKKRKLLDRVVIQTFSEVTLKILQKKYPEIKISFLVEEKPGVVLSDVAKRLKPHIISPEYTMASKSEVKKVHALGIPVLPWTANTPEVWQNLVDAGVDGIISDNPKALMEFLKKKTN